MLNLEILGNISEFYYVRSNILNFKIIINKKCPTNLKTNKKLST